MLLKNKKGGIFLCNFFQKLVQFLESRICFTKNEIEEIKNKVKKVEGDAKRYEKVTEKIPEFYKVATNIKEENIRLENENNLIKELVNDMYIAYVTSDVVTLNECFKRFGFSMEKIPTQNMKI